MRKIGMKDAIKDKNIWGVNREIENKQLIFTIRTRRVEKICRIKSSMGLPSVILKSGVLFQIFSSHFRVGSTAARSDLLLYLIISTPSDILIEVEEVVVKVEVDTNASISCLSIMRSEPIDQSIL